MDGMNLLVLTCAVIAALAFGVLLGYACCQAVFGLIKAHARSLQAHSPKPETAVVQIQTAV